MRPQKSADLGKLKVPLPALMRRINRKLDPHDQQIRKSRGPEQQTALGSFYVLDVPHNAIVHHHVDPEALARLLKAITEHEQLA
jgi:hypothetical protein